MLDKANALYHLYEIGKLILDHNINADVVLRKFEYGDTSVVFTHFIYGDKARKVTFKIYDFDNEIEYESNINKLYDYIEKVIEHETV